MLFTKIKRINSIIGHTDGVAMLESTSYKRCIIILVTLSAEKWNYGNYRLFGIPTAKAGLPKEIRRHDVIVSDYLVDAYIMLELHAQIGVLSVNNQRIVKLFEINLLPIVSQSCSNICENSQ